MLLGNGDGSFQPRRDFPSGFGSLGVVISDLNDDGFADLVTQTRSSDPDTVCVLLGSGDGHFQPAMHTQVGDNPHSVAVGDLNIDNVPDIIVANSSSRTISVLLGNGDGTFQLHDELSAAYYPLSVAVGDFDGDNIPDIAVANSAANSFSIFCGNGNGSFQQRTDFAAGSSPRSLNAGDLDGNGSIDLAIANSSSSVLSVFLNQSGATVPCNPADFETPYGILEASDVTAYLTAYMNSNPTADLNGDGVLNFFDVSVFLSLYQAGCP